MVSKETSKKIEELVKKLPEPEKDRPIIALDGRLFSWNQILEELKKGGKLADRLEAKLSEKTK